MQSEKVKKPSTKKETFHTKTASISSLDTGVLLGWREAFPPTVAEAFELEKNDKLASLAEDAAWVSDAEPAMKFFNRIGNFTLSQSTDDWGKNSVTRLEDLNYYQSQQQFSK